MQKQIFYVGCLIRKGRPRLVRINKSLRLLPLSAVNYATCVIQDLPSMQKNSLFIGLILPFGLSAQNALNFDGTNDNVNCGTKSAFNIGGDSITIEAWIYANSWKTNSYDGTIVNKENNADDGG